MASSLKIAKAEIGYTMGKVQNIHLIEAKNNMSLNLIDLDKDKSKAFSYCLFLSSIFSCKKHAYLISNFI